MSIHGRIRIIFVQTFLCGFIECSDGALSLLHQFETTGLAAPDASQQKTAPMYQRYTIETKNAAPRRKLPHPFKPRVRKLGLAKILLKEVLHYNLGLRKREYRHALLSRPCIYGVFSGRFGGFHPIPERCVGCMRCVQEYPAVCTVDRNPEFYKFADSYWSSEAEATVSGSPFGTVSYEAETGKIPIKGMGYKGAFAGPGWDSIWTDMSEIVRPTRDGVYGREFISTVVDVGRKAGSLNFTDENRPRFSRTTEVSLPIIFDYLPPQLNGPSILASLAGSSARTGTFFIASPNQANQLSNSQRERLIPLISKSMEDSPDLIREARWIELENCDAFPSKDFEFERLKFDPDTTIAVRLPLNRGAAETAVQLVQKGVDVIHITANYHGRGWDNEDPKFIRDLIREVHGKLVSESCRDQVTLVASGGITRAEHVPKAIICGADLVAIDTTVLVALQSRFEGECTSPTTGRIFQEAFDPKWGEQRLVNLLASWHDQLIEILSAMGIRDVRRLRGDVGRAMFNEDLEKEAFKDIASRN
jgi:hypothetical protein